MRSTAKRESKGIINLSGMIACPKKSKLLALSHPQQDRIQRQLPSALLHQPRPRERPFLYTTHYAPANTRPPQKVTSHASEGSFIVRYIVLGASSSVHQKKACVELGAFPFQDLSCMGAQLTLRTLRRLQNSFFIWCCLLFWGESSRHYCGW